MSNNIFEASNGSAYSASTLDMSSAVRNNKYTIVPNFSATSTMTAQPNLNFSATSNFSDRTNIVGGSIDETRSIPIDQSELRSLLMGTSKNTAPTSISGLVNKINSITEEQLGGSCKKYKFTVNDLASSLDSDMDSDDALLIMKGGAPPHLQAMLDLNAHIAKKAGIKYNLTLKIGKHYREEAKKTNPNGNVIELSKDAMKLVDKDANSGKLADVVKRVTGVTPSRNTSRNKSSKDSKASKKTKGSKKVIKKNKQGGFSSSVDSDLSSELSFVSTSTD